MAFYMKGSPFNNGKENRAANKLRRQERRQKAKEIKDSGVSAEQYSFTGHESDMGKYDKKGRHKEFPEQRYSKKNPASNKAASDMMRTNYLSPVNNGKKKSTFGGTPDSTSEQIREEEATNQLYAEGKITESNAQGTRRIKKRVKKLKRQEIRAIRKQNK
tara:strand:- start:749 stop:1228 length:480 start_codon:yes stop_codon:yes gene_type:complete